MHSLSILFILVSSTLGFNFFPIRRFQTLTERKPQAPLNFITLDEVPLVEAAQSSTDKSMYIISEAQASDLDAVVSLRVDVFYPDLEDIKSFHSKVLEKLRYRREEGSVCLIVNKEDKPLGNWKYMSSTIVGTVEFSPTDFKNSPLEAVGRENKLYLMDLAVRRDARNRGIASSLLNSAEKYANNHGYDEILLHVEVGNMKALKLYEKHGYEVYPVTSSSINFTESRLHKPSSAYIFLWKKLNRHHDDMCC